MPVSIEPFKQRPCLDSRYLNKHMRVAAIDLPSREEILLAIGGSEVFSVFDFKDAFKLFLVDEETASCQNIIIPWGCFGSERMQFGLFSSPGLFNEKIKDLLKPIARNCLNYADNVIFFGPIEEQRGAIKTFLGICEDNGLIFNVNKVYLYEESVKFLGMIVSGKGMSVDPNRAEALKKVPKPATGDEMLSLLGKYVYIQKHIANYSKIASQLYPRKDEKRFDWTDRRRMSYEELLAASEKYLTLVSPGENETLELVSVPTEKTIHVELLSKKGLVDVLMRKMTDAEQRYSAIDKELLGIHEYLKTANVFVTNCNMIYKTASKMIQKMLLNCIELSISGETRLQTLVSLLVLMGLKCEFSNEHKKRVEAKVEVRAEKRQLVVKVLRRKLLKKDKSDYLLEEEILASQEKSEHCAKILEFLANRIG
uniref:Reverse transcriptase domain-containing protein n=1 Tax=Rhabditophanes sp. KR3021 TaxID=114890 RepID=A0AC35TXI8_9BILA